jgi:hypothetical protein
VAFRHGGSKSNTIVIPLRTRTRLIWRYVSVGLYWTVLSLPIWDCEKSILCYGEIRGGTERDIEPHDTGGYVYFTGIDGYIFAFLTQQFDSWLSPKTERRQDFIASLCV